MYSIKTKFILVLSFLMAVILAIQVYLTHITQKDILTELENLTESINTTTDKILLESTYFTSDIDSIKKHRFKKGIYADVLNNIKTKDMPFLFFKGDSKRRAEKKEFIQNWITGKQHSSYSYKWSNVDSINTFLFPTPKIEKSEEETIVRVNPGNVPKQIPLPELETIVIDVGESKTSIAGSVPKNGKVVVPKPEKVFSFSFPNLIREDRPQVVRYDYNTAALNAAISKMRDRNILSTILLFSLSLLFITVISASFLKPLKKLNKSFDKVVKGDFNVSMNIKSRDEIAELSKSFNTMVSELKKNKEREEIVNRQERLASLGQLAAGVAHEIKNPLNAINLTISHLNDKFNSQNDRQLAGYIHSIQSEIKRLDKTVNDFLNYVRSEQIKPKRTAINDLLDDVLQLYERELHEQHIKVSKIYSEKFFQNVEADRLKTALSNILVNAIHAMPQGGQLKVKTTTNPDQIIIQDNGCGIPKKNLEHIFDLFYTTKNSGTGLGLPTAFKILESHKAHIKIDSTVNKGTTVSITFN